MFSVVLLRFKNLFVAERVFTGLLFADSIVIFADSKHELLSQIRSLLLCQSALIRSLLSLSVSSGFCLYKFSMSSALVVCLVVCLSVLAGS